MCHSLLSHISLLFYITRLLKKKMSELISTKYPFAKFEVTIMKLFIEIKVC